MWNDLRASVRLLRRNRAFAAAALTVIALATGANSALFSLVYSVVLRPLPFPDPGRLVSITQFYPSFRETVVTGPVYFDWLAGGGNSAAALAAYSIGQYTLTGRELAESVPVARVSQQFFDLLGIAATAGRTFASAEDRPGSDDVVVVGRSFWDTHARRDTLELDGRSYRVIGEMPAAFEFPTGARLWVPLALDAARERAGGPVEMVRVIGRLRGGVTREGLTAVLAGISARVPGFSAGGRPVVAPLRSWMTGKTERVWFVLMGVVAFVLLIACANVAGLMLARGAARRGEMAVRIAIGAPPSRLVRQLLVESLVLAGIGSGVGLALAAVLVRVLLPLIPNTMLAGRPVRFDAPVFAFSAGAAVLIAALFGVAPARDLLRRTRPQQVEMRSLLVAGEVALSLALLTMAGLMVRSFAGLTAVDPGFRADHTLTLEVTLPAAAYREPARQVQFFSEALRALSAMPGVRGAALVSAIPLSNSGAGFAMASVEGEPPWSSEEVLRHRVAPLYVSPGWFRTMGTPMVEGREFQAADMGTENRVVVVNRAFVRRFFGPGTAVGRRIKLGFVESPAPWLTVVGVAADCRQNALEEDAAPAVYRPYAQRGLLRAAGLVLWTAGEPAGFSEAARQTLAGLDAAVAASDVQTMEQRLAHATASQKLRSLASLLLALLALAMVSAGLYGVLSYLVVQRAVELGVRMALGAAPGDVFGLVMRRGVTLALVGIGAGLVLSLAAAQGLRGLLFGIAPADPWNLAGAAVLMLAVSAAASWAPARRATRTDPIRCLRQE